MRKLALLAAGLMAAGAAHADPISLNQWYTFGFGGQGSALVNGTGFVQGTNPASLPAPDGPWTITLSGPGKLVLLDGFNVGDQFDVTDFGSSIGLTSTPGREGTCGSDITACLGNPGTSKGSFLLGAGSHSLGGTAALSPFGGGAGFFIVTDAVPEPASWAMMIAGFAVVGAGMRSRRAKVAFA